MMTALLYLFSGTILVLLGNGVLAFTTLPSASSSSSALVTHTIARSSGTTTTTTTTSSLFVSSPTFPDDVGGNNGEQVGRQGHSRNRHTEFTNLGDVEESTQRQRRMEAESRIEGRFVKFGDDLWTLRRVMTKLSHKLVSAINAGLRDREAEIREQLRLLELQDPELVYRLELEALHDAKREGRDKDARKHGRNAYDARSCLPQYNLDGLWVGK